MNITAKKLSVICCLLLFSASGLAVPANRSLVVDTSDYGANKADRSTMKSKITVVKSIESMGNGFTDLASAYNFRMGKCPDGLLASNDPGNCNDGSTPDNKRGGGPLFSYVSSDQINTVGKKPFNYEWDSNQKAWVPMPGVWEYEQKKFHAGTRERQGEMDKTDLRQCHSAPDSNQGGRGVMCKIAPPDQLCALTELAALGDWELVRLVRGDPVADYPGYLEGYWYLYVERGGNDVKASYNCWKPELVEVVN